MKSYRRWTMTVLLAFVLIGCADLLPRKQLDLTHEVTLEDGLSKLEQTAREHPDNMSNRADYIRERDRVVNFLLQQGDRMNEQGRGNEALSYYRRVLAIDPANARAKDGMAALELAKRQATMLEGAQALFDKSDLDGAMAMLQAILMVNPSHSGALALRHEIDERNARFTLTVMPVLKSKFKQPISLQFRDANLKMVFESLSRASGINILLDRDVKNDLKATIFVKDASVEDTIDLILMQNQLEKKVLNESTVFIYPNTPAKTKEFQDMVIRTFQFTNVDAKQMQTMIKTVLKTKDLYIHEKTNSLVMRDTPEAVQLAEKLIATQDLNDPEVMVDVDVLEVSRSLLTQLGISWPNHFEMSVNPGTLEGLQNINSNDIKVTPLSVMLDLKKEVGDTNVLASPRIRVKQHEKAKVMIGDRVPVITNSVTPVATGSSVVTGSVQYLDTGLKLEVEPDIHMDGEVAIKIYFEVSNIVKEVTNIQSGTIAYQIGTRNATTVLRLRDGETQVLAGLISDADRKTAEKVPGLGDLPVIGRLFTNNKVDAIKTEIVLSITPHIIRNVRRSDVELAAFWSGTDANLRSKPLSLQPVGMVKTGTPSVAVQPASPPAQPAAPVKPTPAAPAAATPAAEPAPATVAVAPVAAKDQALPPAAIAEAPPAPGKLLPGIKTAIAPLLFSWQGASQAKVGDVIRLVVYGQTGSKVVSVPFIVSYDPAVLEALEVTEGDLLKSGNVQTAFNSSIDQSGGKISVDLSQPGQEGAAGRGSLAVMSFRVTAASPQSPITVTGSATNAAGDPVPITLPAPHNMVLLP